MNENSQHFEVAQPNAKAPLFHAESYNNIEKSIVEIQLKDYRGKWIVLFFYPSNFTFV
jgi:alkyl hydroperoxide reductase subunit AhpC